MKYLTLQSVSREKEQMTDSPVPPQAKAALLVTGIYLSRFRIMSSCLL